MRAQAPAESAKSRFDSVSWWMPILALSILTVFFIFRWLQEPAPPIMTAGPVRDAKFVGAAECASCHQHENELWRGSHHQLAMQPAADSTVLGDFNHGSFDNGGVQSSFFRNGSKFMVRTDGPDGALHDYEIGYTFGVYPL